MDFKDRQALNKIFPPIKSIQDMKDRKKLAVKISSFLRIIRNKERAIQ